MLLDARFCAGVREVMAMRTLLSAEYSGANFWLRMLGGLVGLGIGLFVLSRIVAVGMLSESLVVVVAAVMVLALGATMARTWSLRRGLRKVSADEAFLYVADYPDSQEVAIALSDIERVTQWRGRGLRPVIVHLRSDSKFGRRIKFQPALRDGESLIGLKENRVVGELRALAGLN